MGDDDRSDPDRAAILARRQRFIALALSGLSASCGKNGGSPMPCLDVAPSETSSADGSSSSGTPMPCLDIGPMTESSADETGTSSDDGPDTSGTDSTGTDSTGTDSSGTDGSSSG